MQLQVKLFNMKNAVLIAFVFFLLLVSACKKEEIAPPVEPANMKILKATTTFSWKTTTEVQLTLTGNTSGIVAITNEAGIAYCKANIIANTAYTMKLSVPAWEKSVTILFRGKTANLVLSSDAIDYTFI